MRETGQGRFGDVNPSMNSSAHAAVADGLGTLIASTPAMAASAVLGPELIGTEAVGMLAQAGKLAIDL